MEISLFQIWLDAGFAPDRFPEIPVDVKNQKSFLRGLAKFALGLEETDLINFTSRLPGLLAGKITTNSIIEAFEKEITGKADIRKKIILGELIVDFLIVEENWQDCIHRLDLLIDLATESDDLEELSILYNYRGVCFYRLADYTKAQSDLFESLRLADEIDNDRRRARARINLGLVQQEVGLLEEAAGHYREALKLARKAGDDRTELSCYLNIGYIYIELKRWADSRKAIEKGIKLAVKLGEEREALRGELNLGVALLEETGHSGEAIAVFRDVIELSEDTESAEIREIARLNLSTALFQDGKYDEALETSRTSLNEARASGNHENAWRALEASARASVKLGRIDDAEAGFRDALAEFEELRKSLSSRKERIEFKRNLHGLQHDFIGFSIANRPVETAYSRLATSKMMSLFDFAPSSEHVRAESDSIVVEKIKKAVGSRPGSVILDYFLGEGEISLFTCTEREISLHTLDITSERLTGLLKTFYEEINLLIANAEYRKKCLESEKGVPDICIELGKALLGPVADLLHEKSRVYIVPTGILNTVPFGALSLDGQYYLIEDLSISILPSSFFLTSLPARRKTDDRLLIIRGDETGLDWVEYEIAGIKNAWTANVEEKSAAEVFRKKGLGGLIEEMDGVGCAHFTGHASFDPIDPYSSDLHLGNGLSIKVSEILETGKTFRNLKHLTLAACETGAGRAGVGDEVVGLAHSFLSLGLRSVAMSLWKVSDETTSRLMPFYYRAIHSGESIPSALRTAQKTLLEEGRIPPYFFAPFQIIGDD